DQTMALQPHSSGVKIQDPMLDHQDKQMMKAQEIDSSNSDSWGWKNMLLIRDKIKPFVRYKIEDGKDTLMWHDKWCNIGPLDRFISKRDMYNSRLNDDTRVADLMNNGVWNQPEGWSDLFPELQQIPNPCFDV
nr:hypothetical protein [Tanacetum cinerariifolium]